MLSAVIILPKETDQSLVGSLQKIEGAEWNGFYSANHNISGNFGNAIIFSSADILPMVSELLIVLDPTYCTFEYLSNAIRNGCHLFLPEEFHLTIEERKNLIYLAKEGGTLIQVRNDFIFQPLNKKIINFNNGTCFIDVHQATSWETGKLKEKILNNLLLVMLSCGVPFHRIDVFCGTGRKIKHPGIINIHINFPNGSTASITLSFIEGQTVHLMKIFHEKGLNTFDFSQSNDSANSVTDTATNRGGSLAKQIEDFIKNIHEKTNPAFGLTEEIEVSHLMGKIEEKLDLHYSKTMY